jgi:hypothetical protein
MSELFNKPLRRQVVYTSFEIARVRYKVFKLANLASTIGLI